MSIAGHPAVATPANAGLCSRRTFIHRHRHSPKPRSQDGEIGSVFYRAQRMNTVIENDSAFTAKAVMKSSWQRETDLHFEIICASGEI